MEKYLEENIELFLEHKIDFYSKDEKHKLSLNQFEGILIQFKQLVEHYDKKIFQLTSKIEAKQECILAYEEYLLDNKNVIEQETTDIHFNIFVVLAILEQIKDPNYDLTKFENDIDIVKTYININLYQSINRRILAETILEGYKQSEKNLKRIFDYLDINIDYLTDLPKKYLYEGKYLFDKKPDFQLKYIKRLSSQVVDGTFDELFRRANRLAESEIEIINTDELMKESINKKKMKKEGLSKEDIKLLSYRSKLKHILDYIREQEINQQHFNDFTK
jgi:hypothetical protein